MLLPLGETAGVESPSLPSDGLVMRCSLPESSVITASPGACFPALCATTSDLPSAFQERERGLALGLNMVVGSLGVAAGPTIGGFITQSLSWRWIFYVNVPICLLLLLASLHFYKEHHAQ